LEKGGWEGFDKRRRVVLPTKIRIIDRIVERDPGTFYESIIIEGGRFYKNLL
jgi:hypothetical protein